MTRYSVVWKIIGSAGSTLLLEAIDRALDKTTLSDRQTEAIKIVSHTLIPMVVSLAVLVPSGDNNRQTTQSEELKENEGSSL